MIKALYMDDSYLKEFEAAVESVNEDKYIILDQTAFYPLSGGVDCDIGVLIKDNEEYPVAHVIKINGDISHEVSKPGLNVGDKVNGKINWERRYKLMRLHSAAHLVSGILNKKTKALITGGNIDTERARTDFSLENFDRQMIDEAFRIANKLIEDDGPIKVYYMDREEALKIPDMIKLANKMPPEVEKLRVIELVGIDRQADGGAHVKSLKEIGQLEILKLENKGKSNRRVYYTIS